MSVAGVAAGLRRPVKSSLPRIHRPLHALPLPTSQPTRLGSDVMILIETRDGEKRAGRRELRPRHRHDTIASWSEIARSSSHAP